jgi:hypothetical protein
MCLTCEHLLGGEPTTPLCINFGVPLTVLNILAESPLYDRHFIAFHVHGILFNMLTYDHHRFSNGLTFYMLLDLPGQFNGHICMLF